MKYWNFITIVPRMQLLNHSMLKLNFSELILMEWQIKSFSSLESQSPKDIPIKFLLPPKLSINFASSLLKQTCLRLTFWDTVFHLMDNYLSCKILFLFFLLNPNNSISELKSFFMISPIPWVFNDDLVKYRSFVWL